MTDIQNKQLEQLQNTLTNAFNIAFQQMEMQGIRVKDLYWFKSENEKNLYDKHFKE